MTSHWSFQACGDALSIAGICNTTMFVTVTVHSFTADTLFTTAAIVTTATIFATTAPGSNERH